MPSRGTVRLVVAITAAAEDRRTSTDITLITEPEIIIENIINLKNMKYTEAKAAIDRTDITDNSGHWFSLMHGHPLIQSSYTIDMALITAPNMWGEIRECMQRNCLTNEQALRQMGLIDRDDLEVLLLANFARHDRTKRISLIDFLGLRKGR